MKTLCAFEVFVAEKKAQGVSPRTLEAYSYAAKPLIAMSPRLPCKPVILQKYIYDNNWSQEKREFVYRHVRAFMTWFCKREELPNPMGSILRPRVPKKDVKYLSRDQLRLMDVHSLYMRRFTN